MSDDENKVEDTEAEAKDADTSTSKEEGAADEAGDGKDEGDEAGE